MRIVYVCIGIILALYIGMLAYGCTAVNAQQQDKPEQEAQWVQYKDFALHLVAIDADGKQTVSPGIIQIERTTGILRYVPPQPQEAGDAGNTEDTD